ncbi:MAG: hypothetical protein HGA73_04230, partial [Syntrophaceae bacterium]|nr:hypothetical protein [Syntrophaceae bacterium]
MMSPIGAAPRRDLGRRPTCRWRGKSRRGRRSHAGMMGVEKPEPISPAVQRKTMPPRVYVMGFRQRSHSQILLTS